MSWNERKTKDPALANDIAALIGGSTVDFHYGFKHALDLISSMNGFTAWLSENRLDIMHAYCTHMLEETKTQLTRTRKRKWEGGES